MITDDDVKKLATVFTTKADLDRFASKEDIVALERRMDEKYATKEVLFEVERRMHTIENKVEDLELAVNALRSEIESSTDAIIHEFIKAFEKADDSREKVDRHESQIKHMERRFQKIKIAID